MERCKEHFLVNLLRSIKMEKRLSDSFKELIDKRAWYKKSGINRKKAYKDKVAFLEGTLPEDTMRMYLRTAGYVQVQNELWVETNVETNI